MISFALDLGEAYVFKTGFKFGKASWDSKSILQIANKPDLFIFPLVNPDGREHVMSTGVESMWRNNLNPNHVLPCKGVDINRNYDFLWNSGIGTSWTLHMLSGYPYPLTFSPRKRSTKSYFSF